ncbi:hypothetical protein Glo7428_2820 [Gloeocapsa sp. PCC 7428]|uniref:hypothetical protein n=1 Tax=Gloeocapsa sp. PCC 7428 TaxID=1173026 RepID=UPI0002A5E979|nr:hypothetical protein [Gloeocapsa sp. PCC 7428]AFZ31321.1 hypothetical protein Glo7428_2820 [Gloeocapsa sp. PCC 7428]
MIKKPVFTGFVCIVAVLTAILTVRKSTYRQNKRAQVLLNTIPLALIIGYVG